MVLFLMNTETFLEAQFELSKIQRLSRYTDIYPQQKRPMTTFLILTRVRYTERACVGEPRQIVSS